MKEYIILEWENLLDEWNNIQILEQLIGFI